MGTKQRLGLAYSYVLWDEGGSWTAHNPDLHTFGVGRSRSAAVADLAKATALMIEYLQEIGEALPPPRHIEVGTAEL
jgi:predicted RNase H-like HicB family nuclease